VSDKDWRIELKKRGLIPATEKEKALWNLS
jgi:hypothetical protein